MPTVSECCGPTGTFVDGYGLTPTIMDHCRPSWTIVDYRGLSWTVVDRRRLTPTKANRHRPMPTVTNCCGLTPTVADNCGQSRTIADLHRLADPHGACCGLWGCGIADHCGHFIEVINMLGPMSIFCSSMLDWTIVLDPELGNAS